MIINTPTNTKETLIDEKTMRNTAIKRGVPIITTIESAKALSMGLESYLKDDIEVMSLQSWYKDHQKGT